MTRFRTTAKRALGGLATGIGLGAVTLILVVVVSAAIGRVGHIDWNWVGQELSGLALPGLAIVAGLCAIGVLAWLPFHALGWRHWSLAMVVGGIWFFLAWFLPHTDFMRMPLAGDGFDDYGWRDAAFASMFTGLVGVLIAGAMWRVAYRAA